MEFHAESPCSENTSGPVEFHAESPGLIIIPGPRESNVKSSSSKVTLGPVGFHAEDPDLDQEAIFGPVESVVGLSVAPVEDVMLGRGDWAPVGVDRDGVVDGLEVGEASREGQEVIGADLGESIFEEMNLGSERMSSGFDDTSSEDRDYGGEET